MKCYDRYMGKMTANLPSRMDLGRFVVVKDGVAVRDLTNADVITLGDYVVRESLFDETNQNIHDLLHTIADSYASQFEKVMPIIQKFNIDIGEFERLIDQYKFHLRAIVSCPHSLLDKDTMKVNIGRAKRISSRSYQYLAHHSEDWEKMSVMAPKPRKILHEELIIDFAVYENLLLRAFLQEAVKHLSKRIKETADITKFFLSIFDKKKFENVWHDKIDRSNALVGRAAKLDQSKDSNTTNRTLTALKTELVKLERSSLFEDFPKHSVSSITYHETNVLNSHKHYKYLKILWLELVKLKEQTGKEDAPLDDPQLIMSNMRIYVKALFVYSLEQLNYAIFEDGETLKTRHPNFPSITMFSDPYDVLHIFTNNAKVKVVTLGGMYDIENAKELSIDTICFCFNDYQKPKDNMGNVYFVNPIDTNSIECSGQVIRKLIIREYISITRRKYEFKHNLRDFVSVVRCKEIIFDKKGFTYSFAEQIPNQIDESEVLTGLKSLPEFRKRSRKVQELLMSDMSKLIADIDANCSNIKDALVCPKCAKRYRTLNTNYLECDCGFICDLSNDTGKFYYSDKDGKYSNITEKGWGMDRIG